MLKMDIAASIVFLVRRYLSARVSSTSPRCAMSLSVSYNDVAWFGGSKVEDLKARSIQKLCEHEDQSSH